MSIQRPTGIIKTLPAFYWDDKNEAGRKCKIFIRQLEAGKIDTLYFQLKHRPKIEVLHFYLLVAGQIRCRFNIAGIEEALIKCFDNTIRDGMWVTCTAPVSWSPESVIMRGFQGFRYTDDLW